MATLSSSSTDQAVWDAYDDNASYDEDNSAAKAKIFITACRILIRRRPNLVTTDGQSVQFNGRMVQKELDQAQQWLGANKSSAAGSVRHLDFRNLRT